MINDIKMALRSMRKQPLFSLINLSGLSVGMGVFILIILWINYELSINNYHSNGERIGAIMHHQKLSDETVSFPAVSNLLAPALMRDLPEIEWATTTSWGDNRQFTVDNKNFIEYGLYVSPEFLKIFNFPLLPGNLPQALQAPRTILISQSLATKYFGSSDPVGQTIIIEQAQPYKVTGVLKDVPKNSTLTFDFLMPIEDYLNGIPNPSNWEMSNVRAYVQWKEGVSDASINARVKNILSEYTDKLPKSNLSIWKLSDWYLRYDFKDGQYAGGGRIVYVRLFMVIALIILILACINFMNLSTARATQRAKEVGIRKVVGAGKIGLTRQFLAESLLFALLGGGVALLMVYLILPVFNQVLRRDIQLNFTDYRQPLLFLAIIGASGILAGSYPSMVLSAFKPLAVIKSNLTPASSGHWIRKGLVVFQFFISIVLVSATWIVSKQINYVNQRDLGYQKDHLIWFQNNITMDKIEPALEQLAQLPGVKSTALSSTTFTMSNNRGTQFNWRGKSPDEDVFFNFIAASNNIAETMGLQVVEGRDFADGFRVDTGAYILNEEAVRQMHLENPIGEIIETYGGKGEIVGVVKDFHLESLHNPIGPVIITCQPDWTWTIYTRLQGDDLSKTIQQIEQVYKNFAPGFVFEYNFQDQEYERLYRSDHQIGTLVKWFAGLAIFISCLGLLGLAAFTVERKTKEIGIRKVLGATAAHLLGMITKQYVILLLISLLLAIVPAYYLLDSWLNKFAYHINLEWWTLPLIGTGAIVLPLAVIVILTLHATRLNPVNSIRDNN